MGRVQCEVHGRCSVSAVSPAVERAVWKNERWPTHDLVRIRSELTDDQEPRARIWLDRATVGDRDEEVVPPDEAMDLASGFTCCKCLEAWLRENGIDNEYSAEEQRFLRIAEALAKVMRPRLEPSLEAISDLSLARHGRGERGFPTGRGCPFSAYAGSVGGPVAQVEVRDRTDHLIAAVVLAPAGATAPDPLRIDLVYGELDDGGLAGAAAWADAVARAISPQASA